MVIAIMVPVVFFILIGIIIMLYFRRRHRKRMESMERERLAGLHGLEGYNPQRAGESTMNDALLEQGGDMTSGSGSGAPRCIERNLANNIDLKNLIGQGRFGQVKESTLGILHLTTDHPFVCRFGAVGTRLLMWQLKYFSLMKKRLTNEKLKFTRQCSFIIGTF